MNFLNENLSIEETDFEIKKFNIIVGYEKNFISRLIYLSKRVEKDVIYISAENFSLLTLQI
jgi:hypothetical protein